MTVKLDPVAYVLLLGVLALQIYGSFLRGGDTDKALAENEAAYQHAVFEDSDTKGIMQQVFRQNEVDRELLKRLVATCGQ